ncbi:hypothetical protein TcasGA2_TC033495 [Tribolium castaneum]|uniref:THAP-type domain-containing protein n=1 Tax=Tribolium castaneum TaxID=7070 RepID=A0A139WDY0_TRICA|nr:hypothetical protein TcasGA2_TC033495 [Tribolium castaneum]
MKSNYHCAVKDCKREFCALHRFPKFNEQPERFRLFVEATGNDNLKKLTPRKIYDRIRICNNHFKLEDMRRVGDNRFALFRHAVPSVNIYEI